MRWARLLRRRRRGGMFSRWFLEKPEACKSSAKAWHALRLELLEERTLLSIRTYGIPTWIGQGPNAIGLRNQPNTSIAGAIQGVAGEPLLNFDGTPTGQYALYAATIDGGVWRADNFTDSMVQATGQPPPAIHWTPLTDQEPTLATSSIALDPFDPSGNTVWVGTGDVSSAGGRGAPPDGLLKTTDGLDPSPTWMVLGNETNSQSDISLRGHKIISVVPANLLDPVTGQQVVLVACLDGQGILRSADGGQTFQLVNGPSGALTGPATDVIEDPNAPATFYATIAATFDNNNNVVTPSMIVRSTDGGVNWTEIDSGIPQVNAAHSLKLAIFNNASGVIQGAGPTVLYVGESSAPGNSNGLTGVFRTANPNDPQNPPQWDALATSVPNSPASAQVPYFAMAVDPNDWNNLYFGGQSWLYRLELIPVPILGYVPFWFVPPPNPPPGGGTSPFDWSSGAQSDHRSFTFLTNNILLSTGDQGVYGLYNPETNNQWVSLDNSIDDTEFFSVAYDRTTGLISGGAQDVGTSAGNSSTSWIQLPNGGGDGGMTGVDASGVHYYFTDSQFQRDGATVQLNGLIAADRTSYNQAVSSEQDGWSPFALNPSAPGQLVLAMSHLYESTTGGDSLFDITPQDIFGNILMQGGVSPYGPGFAYGVDNPAALYVTTTSGQIFLRTTNTESGTDFQLLAPPPAPTQAPWTSARQIVVDPSDYRHAFVLEENNGRIWEITNAGTNNAQWTQLDNNLPQLMGLAGLGGNQVHNIEFYQPTPQNDLQQPSVLLAATTTGVYRMLNPGPNSNWYKFGIGLPNAPVLTLRYDPVGDVLLAGTYGRGAWTIPNASFILTQPNPSVYVLLGVGENVRVHQDPNLPQMLDIDTNGGSTPSLQIDAAAVQTLHIVGSDQNLIALDDVPSWMTLGINDNVELTGSDTVNLSPTTFDMSHIQGQVNLNAWSGSITLNAFDQNDGGNTDWTITNDSVASSQIFPINLAGNVSLNVNAGSGANSYAIFGTPSGTTTIRTGNGRDEVTIYGATGPLTVDGGNGGDSFTVNNTSSQPSVLTTLNTVGGNDHVDVNATTGPLTVSLASSGNPTVDVSPTAQNLFTLQGTLSVNGSGFGTLTLEDQNDPPPNSISLGVRSYQLSATQFVATYSTITAMIQYSQVANLTILGSGAGQTWTVSNTAADTSTHLVSDSAGDIIDVQATAGPLNIALDDHSGNTKVNVSATAHNLETIQGNLSVAGQGAGSLTLNDQTNPWVYPYTLDGSSVSRAYVANITYSGLSDIKLYGGRGLGRTYTIQNTAANATTLVATANGDDVINVEATTGPLVVDLAGSGNPTVSLSPTAQNLSNIQGNVKVNGTGFGTVNLDDQAGPSINMDVLDAKSFSRTNFGGLSYGGLASLNFNAAAGNSLPAYRSTQNIFVLGTPATMATTIKEASGWNDITIGLPTDPNVNTTGLPGTPLDNILGPVTVVGQAYQGVLTLWDWDSSTSQKTYEIDSNGHPNSISATTVASGVTSGLISWQGSLSVVGLYGSWAADTFNLRSLPTGLAAIVINGGYRANTFQSFMPERRTWAIYANTAVGSFIPGECAFDLGEVYNLAGGPSGDDFLFLPNYGVDGRLAGILNGNGGTLDYSQDSSPITVNLANDSATNIDGGAAGGFSNIGSVIGNNRSTTLVGPDVPNYWTITGNNQGNLGQKPKEIGNFTFSQVPNLTGGAVADTFIFQATGSISGFVNGADGINGGGNNTLDLSAFTSPLVVHVFSSPYGGTVAGVVHGFALCQNVVGGQGDDRFIIDQGNGLSNLDGGGGNNTLDLSPYYYGPQNVGILQHNGGYVSGEFGTFSNIQNLVTGSTDDTFAFRGTASLDGTIDAGGGTNTLNFIQLSSPAAVTLTQDGPSSGVSGTTSSIGGGFSSIDSIIGNGPGSTLDGTGYSGSFAHTLTVSGFDNLKLTVPGDFTGSLLASTEGTVANPVGPITVDGSVDAGAKIKVNFLSSFNVGGNMSGTLKGFGSDPSTPTIAHIAVTGDFLSPGLMEAPTFGTVSVHDFGGTLVEGNPTQDFQEIDISGSLLASGSISAGSGGALNVTGDLAGTVAVTGALQSLYVGGNLTGSASAAIIGTVTVVGTSTGQVQGYQSMYILDPTAGGALSLSGNGSINIPGSVYVDSNASTALSASGNASVQAASIQVVGNVKKSRHATINPTPLTGAAAVPNPLAGLAGPSTSGMTSYGAAKIGGNSTQTLNPGIYSQITISGNANVTFNPGIYLIEGGGLAVSGNARVKGTGVTIYNAGSNYPSPGGAYGAITLGGNSTVSLTAPSTGAYAGLVLIQDSADGKALTISGNASGLLGLIDAPKAQLQLSGNAQLNAGIVVDTMTVSGNSIANIVSPSASAGTVVYTPAQIRAAYGINNLSLDGTGQTIAIVDAYDNPAIFQALDAYDSQFGLTGSGPTLYAQYGPATSFLTVMNQYGQTTSLPTTDPAGAGTDNWEVETALDVEWAHAMAPGAQIILVEADSQALSDLMAGVATAAAQPGVSVVSMSWGYAEGLGVLAADEAAYDGTFTTPGVTFVGSTGDHGAAYAVYPAFSPNVLAVGGTSLSLNADNSYNSETGWGYYSDSTGTFIAGGGGISQYETEPTYQLGVQSTGYRTTPDVSFVADPATGAWVADPYNLDPSNPWEVVGGTSLSAPCWGGLIVLVNQGRAARGQPALNSSSPTQAQQALYSLSQSDYNVITSGFNGYSGGPGYNLVTGMGTPIANLLIPDLIAGNFPSSGQVAPISAAELVYTTINSDSAGGVAQAMNVFTALTTGHGHKPIEVSTPWSLVGPPLVGSGHATDYGLVTTVSSGKREQGFGFVGRPQDSGGGLIGSLRASDALMKALHGAAARTQTAAVDRAFAEAANIDWFGL